MLLDVIACLRFLLQGSFSHFAAVLKAEIYFLLKTALLPGLNGKGGKGLAVNYQQTLIVWEYFVRGKQTFQSLPFLLIPNSIIPPSQVLPDVHHVCQSQVQDQWRAECKK